MAGLKENIAPMWKAIIKAGIDLDPPEKIIGTVYLGCGVVDCELQKEYKKQRPKYSIITRTVQVCSEKTQKIHRMRVIAYQHH